MTQQLLAKTSAIDPPSAIPLISPMPTKPRKTAPAGCVELHLHGKFEGGSVSTKHVPLSLLTEFTEATKAFVKGGDGQGMEEDPVIAIVEGSLVHRIPAAATVLIAAITAFSQNPQKLWEADPARARALVSMKAITQKHAGTGVTLRTDTEAFEITPHTKLERAERPEAWVQVTRYLRGTVVQMGGANACNLHLRPAEGGSLIKIDATQEQMKGKDWLYETVLVHIAARQHLVTKEEADYKLIKLVGPLGKVPFEERLKKLTDAHKGRWAGVTDAAAYVRGLRDGTEDAA